MKQIRSKLFISTMVSFILLATACSNPAAQVQDTQTAQSDTSESITIESTQESETKAVAKEETATYSKGTWSGLIYTNKTLGFTFTLPDGWMIADDENIEKTVGGNEAVGGTDKKNDKKNKKNESPYDFMIVNSTTNDNLILLAEDVSTAMAGNDMTAENYLTTIKTNLISGQQTKYIPGEITTVQIAGQTYSKLDVSVVYNGYTTLTQTYYCRKAGNHMVSLIASTKNMSDSEATTDTNTCSYILTSMKPVY